MGVRVTRRRAEHWGRIGKGQDKGKREGEGKGERKRAVPVRPSTLVTLTSLTGILPESMLAASLFYSWWGGSGCMRLERGVEATEEASRVLLCVWVCDARCCRRLVLNLCGRKVFAIMNAKARLGLVTRAPWVRASFRGVRNFWSSNKIVGVRGDWSGQLKR